MSRLVSVDPGKKACGVAVFKGRALQVAALVWRANYVTTAAAVYHFLRRVLGQEQFDLVVEFPRIYPAAKQVGDQNDLLEVAAVAGAVESALFVGVDLTLANADRVIPRDWKGTIDGESFIERRILPALSVEERSRAQLPSARSLQHNVWDAVGIGLHALGRLEPRRVFPR